MTTRLTPLAGVEVEEKRAEHRGSAEVADFCPQDLVGEQLGTGRGASYTTASNRSASHATKPSAS